MAINFPASPSVGQQYVFNGVTYTFTSQSVWVSGVTANLPATGVWHLHGLSGQNNAGTPTTKFDFSYKHVTLMDASGNTTRDTTSSTFTVDAGAAGPVVNGRDQSGAFSASQFLHFYVIGGPGQTTAGLVSATGPDTFAGATLPSGYTRWAYICSVYWNGSSNLISVHVRGGWVYYDAHIQVITAGTSTTEVAVSLTSVAPAVAGSCSFGCRYIMDSTAGAQSASELRHTSGQTFIQVLTADNAVPGQAFFAFTYLLMPNVGQNLYYLNVDITGTADLIRQTDLWILGYSVPNGDN